MLRNIHLREGSSSFPLDVPTICALLTTKEEDKILDCFSGTSVFGDFEGANNRYYIGYELNPEFVVAAEVMLIKLPLPWAVFGEADRQEFLEENVYPKWDKEKEENKIKYESAKRDVYTGAKSSLGK